MDNNNGKSNWNYVIVLNHAKIYYMLFFYDQKFAEQGIDAM